MTLMHFHVEATILFQEDNKVVSILLMRECTKSFKSLNKKHQFTVFNSIQIPIILLLENNISQFITLIKF